MDDLISRQAVLNALDSINCFGWVEDSWTKVSGIIEHVPAAQPKIIFCKDCSEWDSSFEWCNRHWGTMQENDFCSKAERRTDETD